METQKLFGKRIKELRKKNNLTQEQLAELLGVFPKQIGNIETGTTFTTMANIEKLAQILNVSIQDLFTIEHNKSKENLIIEINNLLYNANEEKIKLVYKVVKDILV